MRGSWNSATAGEMCGSSPEAEVVTRSMGTGRPGFSRRAASMCAFTAAISFLFVGPSWLPAEFAASYPFPAADGLGFVRLVRQDDKLHDVPIVLMTDHTLSELDRTFTNAGVADVMVKPLAESEIREAASNFAAPRASQ